MTTFPIGIPWSSLFTERHSLRILKTPYVGRWPFGILQIFFKYYSDRNSGWKCHRFLFCPIGIWKQKCIFFCQSILMTSHVGKSRWPWNSFKYSSKIPIGILVENSGFILYHRNLRTKMDIFFFRQSLILSPKVKVTLSLLLSIK